MGTEIWDIPTKAGVECPRKKGEMSNDSSCEECIHYVRCIAALAEELR